MGFIRHLREEYKIIRDRDPAIKSPAEVLLYPSFRVMLSYRRAHKLYLKGHFFWADLFHSGQREKQELRYIREQRSGKDFLLITEVV